MILKHVQRKFDSVEEQIESMTNSFNEVLVKGDILYILGDTTITKDGHLITERFLRNLNATEFHLIVGNHDSKKVQQLNIWKTVSQIKEVKDDGNRLTLCHYPIMQWFHKEKGKKHLHGHSHGAFEYDRNAVDVGVDCWDFKPIVFADILQRIEERKLK